VLEAKIAAEVIWGHKSDFDALAFNHGNFSAQSLINGCHF
jgi:hypothetical protein